MGNGKKMGPAFALNPQLKYYVYIHDPTFFIQAYEPLPTPGVLFLLAEGLFLHSRYISVTKHRKRNEKTNPCNENPNYDFQLCVRNSLTRKVGCRMPWDLRSSPNIPLCSGIDQANKFQEVCLDISLFSDLESIINKTGCIAPGFYKEYKLVLEPSNIEREYKGLYLAFTDNKVMVEEEIESYSGISLVSEIGGALGLFLGFSFVMVWDAAEVVIRKICNM
jgi:hypothetical protein